MSFISNVSKKLTCFSAIFLLFFLFSAYISITSVQASSSFYTPPVLDYAQLLTEEEELALTREIQRISAETGMDFGVVTYNEEPFYASLLKHIKEDIGVKHFKANRYIMALNLHSREMVLEKNGTGDLGMEDYTMNKILDSVAPQFTARNYSQGFMLFLSLTEEHLKSQSSSSPVSEDNKMSSTLLMASFFIAFLTSGGITFYFVQSMNNVREQNHASNYLNKSEFVVTHDREVFLYRNVVTTPKAQSSSSGGSRGGGSRGSPSGGGSRGF